MNKYRPNVLILKIFTSCANPACIDGFGRPHSFKTILNHFPLFLTLFVLVPGCVYCHPRGNRIFVTPPGLGLMS